MTEDGETDERTVLLPPRADSFYRSDAGADVHDYSTFDIFYGGYCGLSG